MKMYTTKIIEWIESEIALIDNDPRLVKPAPVQVDAPLALVQTGLASRRQALKEVRAKMLEVIDDNISQYYRILGQHKEAPSGQWMYVGNDIYLDAGALEDGELAKRVMEAAFNER